MSAEEPFAKTQLSAGDAPVVGSTIAGRYKVERLLGQGGMGAVYLVQHTGIRKRLALKLLRSEFMAQPDVLARFEREAMAAAHLDHPNVAAASDYGRTEDGQFFLVLEYVEGQELRAIIEQTGALPLGRALFIARQIAGALARAHELDIVHRDLKPENIMLIRREGHGDFVKVLDFGLAQVPRRITEEPESDGTSAAETSKSGKLTKIGDIFGTPAYMSPEQSVGASTDVRTDLYSLGIILYEMLAGMRPFTGKSLVVMMQQHLTQPPPPISERNPAVKVPKEVEALLQRLLAKDPDARIREPLEVLAEIDRIAAMQQIAWPTASSPSSISLSREVSEQRSAPRSEVRRASPRETLQRILPPNLQRLRQAPRWLQLGGAALLCGLVLGIILHARRDGEPGFSANDGRRTATKKPQAEVALAPQGALDAAVAQGPEAIEGLLSRYPSDSRILRALVRSYSSQKKHADAMRTIARFAAIDPAAGTDAEVIKAIIAAVQSDAGAEEAAATLLERDLGEAGVELLYDLTSKQTGARWKPRLNQSLGKPEVLAHASPAVRLALELRAAKRCEAKRDLLPRVVKEGDRRALAQLKSMTQTQGCGFLDLQDCWPCLRKTTALQDAITALESRLGPQKP